MKPHIKIRDKVYYLSKVIKLSFVVLVVLAAVAYFWSLVGGIWLLGKNYLDSGFLGLFVFILLFGSFALNGKPYSILADNKVNKFLTSIVCVCISLYYINSLF